MATWLCPAGVTSVIVECWGGGPGGRIGAAGYGSGGGGGAAYARGTCAVTPGNNYTYTVGVGGPANNNGGDSQFTGDIGPEAVSAHRGGAAGDAAKGIGGQAASSSGTTKFSGGDGADAPNGYGGSGPGGGGGSCASRGGAGANGSGQSGAPQNAEAGGGGNGGATGPLGPVGTTGQAPGGGTGGSGDNVGSPVPPAGPEGAVVIWEDLGAWPPFGQTPIDEFGAPVDNTTFISGNPKTRKSAFMV